MCSVVSSCLCRSQDMQTQPSFLTPDGGPAAAGHHPPPSALDAAARPFAPRPARGSYGSGSPGSHDPGPQQQLQQHEQQHVASFAGHQQQQMQQQHAATPRLNAPHAAFAGGAASLPPTPPFASQDGQNQPSWYEGLQQPFQQQQPYAADGAEEVMARPHPNRTMPGTWAAASSALGEQGVAHPYRACGGVAAVSGPPEGKETGLFPASAYGRRLKARVVPFGRTRPVPSSICSPRPAGAAAGC